jgi:hypothetical protein
VVHSPDTLTEPPEAPTRQVAERYLRERRYFVLGTDCHRLDSLEARLSGLQYAIELVGQAEVDRLTITNAQRLL